MQEILAFFIPFIRLACPFWNSENKIIIRLETLAFILLTLLQIGIAVVITEWSAALFNAIEKRSMTDLLTQIVLLLFIFIASMTVTTSHLIVKRRLLIGWRTWLTERVIGRWMNNGRHYEVTHIQTAEHDNPDGRISEDIRIATEEAIGLGHSLFYSTLLLISFSKILWTLSGTIVIDFGFFEIPIYGHLVWVAIIYAVCASILGWWVGRPLTMATDIRQSEEANFRFGLIKARENSQAIALIHGETNEQKRFLSLFQNIIAAYQQQTNAWVRIELFTSGYAVLSMAFPILVSAPRYVLGSISLGALMQSAQAFQHMTNALSWPVNNMAAIAKWRASVERVLSLIEALDCLEQEICHSETHQILVEKPENYVLRLHDLCLSKHDGEIIVSGISAEIKAGERVLISGDAATGAKLIKAIAGLWHWGHGRIELPDADPMFFMPPRPYLPNGTLRSAINYPAAPETYSQDTLEKALSQAGLDHLIDQLDQEDEWETSLSREQQQRLGLVRLLLNRPKWVLLQEAFDSLDPEGEVNMLSVITKELPEATLLTITNQPTAEAFHERRIILPPINHK
ncbi:MAG: ABC transporter ATP-binding protein/permease [Methylococcaceae bacterium]|nr:ABC transporter ATP-binding protein/permease [Methylococcaceae bacterium]